MAEYPTIDEPREDVTYMRPDPPRGARPPWARSEDYVRWGLTAVYIAAMAGLATTLGGSVAPWVGWVVLLIASGAPALVFWGKFMEHQGNMDRLRNGAGPGGPMFTGGTSFGVGPGRDDPGHRHPDPADDPSDQDTSYP